MPREGPQQAFKDWRVLAVIAAIVVAVVTLRDWYLSNPPLTGSNTAYDYLSASHDRQYEWRQTMCHNGVCLTLRDWKCGWWPETDATDGQDWYEVVRKCFETIVERTKPHEKLHKLRQICGRRYMTFKGIPHSDVTRENCAKLGGKWGEKQRVWADEDDVAYRDK